MSYLRTISISTVLLLQPLSSLAKNLNEDFQRCASAALQERGKSATAISVDNGNAKWHELDHDASPYTSKYRLLVTNKTSGENLGTVTCVLDRSGDIIAANFDV